MDVVMPDGNGLEVIPTLLGSSPRRRCSCSRCRTIPATCARHSPPARAVTCSRRRPTSKSSRAVREVARGGRYVHPELGARLDRRGRRCGPASAEEDPLSDREREVLRLLALGHTNQEIAKQLYISVRTAETHRAHIMQKLRLSTRAELVRYALAHGLLEA